MNRKDMFIREKLQQDKQISDKADKIFNNFKEEFKLEDNEGRKVIKISFNKFLAIAASVAIVGALGTILCVNKPWENKLKSNIQAEEKNEPKIPEIVLDKDWEKDSIKLEYPSDWELTENKVYAEPTVLAAPGDNDDERAKLYITINENTGNRSAKEIIKEATNPDYGVPTETISEGEKDIASVKAYYKTQSMSYDDGSNHRSTTIILIKDIFMYEFRFTGVEEEYNSYYPVFEKILETVEFMKSEADNQNNSEFSDLCGDVNCDGIVNNSDRVYLTRHVANWEGYDLTEQGKKNADLNLDGKINKTDVDILQGYLVGNYTSLPQSINDLEDSMKEMLKYRNEDYKANYYYRLSTLKNNNNGTYTATVDFYSPIFISEENYKNIKDSEWGEIEGVLYTFSNESNGYNIGYGYLYKDNVNYTIEKQDRGYAFYSESGGVIKTIKDESGSFEMTLNKDLIIQEYPTGERYILNDYADRLTNDFIDRNIITFEYDKDVGEIYIRRDVR